MTDRRAHPPGGGRLPASANGRRLLIVDDDVGFREAARELLDGAAFQVVGEAADGAGALTQVRALVPEVVLLDVQLPDVSGFQVCKTILDSDGARGISVVLCSVRRAADYGAAVRRCGARGFLAKDRLSAEALLSVIDA